MFGRRERYTCQVLASPLKCVVQTVVGKFAGLYSKVFWSASRDATTNKKRGKFCIQMKFPRLGDHEIQILIFLFLLSILRAPCIKGKWKHPTYYSFCCLSACLSVRVFIHLLLGCILRIVIFSNLDYVSVTTTATKNEIKQRLVKVRNEISIFFANMFFFRLFAKNLWCYESDPS